MNLNLTIITTVIFTAAVASVGAYYVTTTEIQSKQNPIEVTANRQLTQKPEVPVVNKQAQMSCEGGNWAEVAQQARSEGGLDAQSTRTTMARSAKREQGWKFPVAPCVWAIRRG